MIAALYGGTFDPFHAGHLALVEHLLARDYAERVLVVPAGRSPFRAAPEAAGEHRLAMARAALGGLPNAAVDGRETRRRGPSYTVDTLRELSAEDPTVRWRLVMGADLVADFARWRDPEGIVALVDAVLVVVRGPWQGELPPLLAGTAVVVADFRHPASASRIRRELAAGDGEVSGLTAPVATYIAAHGLYGSGGKPVASGREED